MLERPSIRVVHKTPVDGHGPFGRKLLIAVLALEGAVHFDSDVVDCAIARPCFILNNLVKAIVQSIFPFVHAKLFHGTELLELVAGAIELQLQGRLPITQRTEKSQVPLWLAPSSQAQYITISYASRDQHFTEKPSSTCGRHEVPHSAGLSALFLVVLV